jgi:hypothetical protein
MIDVQQCGCPDAASVNSADGSAAKKQLAGGVEDRLRMKGKPKSLAASPESRMLSLLFQVSLALIKRHQVQQPE